MHDIAITLSIISSILIIIYLLGLIFGSRKKDNDVTITISGRIVTTTVTQHEVVERSTYDASPMSDPENRVIDGEVIDAKKLQSQVENILKNVK